MSTPLTCPNCHQGVTEKDLTCPSCKARIRNKTVKEAYGSWGGLGLFDLIPGIRDWPYGVRVALVIVILGVIIVILPLLGRGR